MRMVGSGSEQALALVLYGCEFVLKLRCLAMRQAVIGSISCSPCSAFWDAASSKQDYHSRTAPCDVAGDWRSGFVYFAQAIALLAFVRLLLPKRPLFVFVVLAVVAAMRDLGAPLWGAGSRTIGQRPRYSGRLLPVYGRFWCCWCTLRARPLWRSSGTCGLYPSEFA